MKAAALPLFAVLLGLSTAVVAEGSPDGGILVKDAWARIAPNEDNTVSVFFEVLNTGDNTDVLVDAHSPVAKKVTIRKGNWRGLDFLNKKQDEGIRIKASKRTSFHPGAMEVTLSNLRDPAAVGETIPVTLVFRDAGEVVIQPTVSNQLLGNRFRK